MTSMVEGPPRTPARALLLDLDNTLVDRDAAFLRWLTSRWKAPESQELEAIVALDRGGYGDKRALFIALGSALGMSPARARAAHDEELPGFVTLQPDAAALLQSFPGPKVVITNGAPRLQRAKIGAARLDGRVDAILVSGEIGMAKPDPSIFLRGLAIAGVRAQDAAMIGDHPVLDVAAARALGIRAWMRRTRWFDVPAGVPSVARLTEVEL